MAILIDGRARDLGGFSVRRVLPSVGQRLVGPFIFFDEMGPATFEPGGGIDVRPHPHIGLATVTYLFAGEILHRDSLGSHQPIHPGDINWMTAGRGIVHSERPPEDARHTPYEVHGLQLWVALPKAHEEIAPAFVHHPRSTLPEVDRDGVRLRVLAGSAYGVTSPVAILSPLFYVDVSMAAGSELQVPDEHEERAAYVVEGEIRVGDVHAGPGRMVVFDPKTTVVLHADAATRLVLVGGAPLDGERHLFWNFVSSSEERIDQAKREWRADQFPKVPGDDVEFIPLP